MLESTTTLKMMRPRTQESSSRNLRLDFAKGVLILLVIIGHLLQSIIHREGDSFWASPYFKSIYMFHMPLFMGISGYLSSGAVLRRSFIHSASDRARQLLLPMLFWCGLIWAVKFFFVSHPSSFTANLLDFWKELIGTYWFIWAAFFSSLLVRLLASFNRFSIWIIGASAIVVASVPVTVSIIPLVRYTYPFFCLGFLFAQGIAPAGVILRHKSALMVLLLVTFLCFLAWGKETYAYNNLVLIRGAHSAEQVLLMFIGSAAASAVAMQFISLCWRVGGSVRIPRFVAVEIGQSTLLIYLVQGAVFRAVDLIQFGEHWDLSTRVAGASVLGVAIVVLATLIRRIVRDLGCAFGVVVGAHHARPLSQSGRARPGAGCTAASTRETAAESQPNRNPRNIPTVGE
ncbi:acyltransferase family protein [Bradyrhizobium sp. BRP14]|nr:acyltransferase family protein [Bradyrhizobium sp. BRP14]